MARNETEIDELKDQIRDLLDRVRGLRSGGSGGGGSDFPVYPADSEANLRDVTTVEAYALGCITGTGTERCRLFYVGWDPVASEQVWRPFNFMRAIT